MNAKYLDFIAHIFAISVHTFLFVLCSEVEGDHTGNNDYYIVCGDIKGGDVFHRILSHQRKYRKGNGNHGEKRNRGSNKSIHTRPC